MSACCFTRSANDPASAIVFELRDRTRHTLTITRSSVFQLHDCDRLSAAILGFRANAFDQRMRVQKFGKSATKRARAVPMNNAYRRPARKRSLIQKFIHAPRRFLHGACRSH